MKKNLIALAVATAFVAPTMASAETSVYGLAQVELSSHDPEADTGCSASAGGAKCDSYLNEVDNANGRVGVKASEDLGNGWEGLAKFEFKADTADNATGSGIALASRESMVGLKGKGVGQFELGRLKSPYKYSGGVKYDPFVATNLEARNNGGMTGGDYGSGGFLSNTIGYRGNFGPVKVQFVYGPQTNDGMYALSALYAQDNFEVGVAAIDEGDRDSGAGFGTIASGSDYLTYSSTKIFGKYTMGMHTIVAQYEMTDPSTSNPAPGDKTYKPTFMFLGYHATMGKNMFVVEYGSMDADGATATVGTAEKSLDTTMLVLGVVHKMSKTTRIFGGYRSTSNDAKMGIAGSGSSTIDKLYLNDPTESVITVGLRKDFK